MFTLSTYRATNAGSGTCVGRTRPVPIRAGVAALVGALARELKLRQSTVARERKLRRSMKELASLDERMLRDIGLTRWDVERAVRFGRT